jgi:hypothetical protein
MIGRMWKAIAFVALTCASVLLTLRILGQLNTAETVRDFVLILGWIVTVLVATHQQRSVRDENDRSKREELRRSLQAEAFRQLSDASVKFLSEVGEIGSKYSVAAFSLGQPSPLSPETTIRNVYARLTGDLIELYRAMSRFAFVIETYQLALSDIHHLYLYIRFRVDDVARQLGAFPMSLPEGVALVDAVGREAFRTKCSDIGERLNNVSLYIGDFRIEVMNSLVGSLFDRRVPRRRPAKTSIKTLVELATPEAVAEENQQRTIEAIADGVELTRARERPA